MSTPYKDRALAHHDKGWAVFPCAPKGKEPLVKGRSGGYQSAPVSREVVEAEVDRFDRANIGIRIPNDMIGLDLDLRVNEETGEVLADGYESFLTLDLPPTIGLAHQTEIAGAELEEANPYRHHLYRVPDEVTPEDIARLRDNKGGVDLLRWMHRLTVGSGSVHKNGDVYRFVRRNGSASNGIPVPTMATALTLEEWERIVEFFGERSHVDTFAVGNVDLQEWLDNHDGPASDAMRAAVAPWKERAPDDQRHAAAGLAAYRVAQEAEDGETGAHRALIWLRHQFVDAISDRATEDEAQAEWDRLLVSAVGKAVAKTEAGEREGPAVLDLVIEHPKAPEDDLDHPAHDAYASSMNAQPMDFTREYLRRHFTIGEDVTLRYVNTAFWRWSEVRRHWVRITDDQIRAWIAGDLRTKWETNRDGMTSPIDLKPKNVNDVFASLKMITHDEPEIPTGGVPFEDGWLDVATGALLPVSPKRFNTWCVPALYEDADCPRFLRFLDTINWTEDSTERRALRQWIGYLVSGEHQRQKMLLLHGPTRSGKGTILALCYKMMGTGATGLSIGSLAGEFGLQPLLGKSLAVVGDARFTAKVDKAVVEKLLSISGRDPQIVNVKNKEQVSTQLGTRIMMATNERPVFTESSNALPERFLILTLTKSFLGHEDLGLGEALSEELAGIIRWSLEGLKDLHANGFVETEAGVQMKADFVMDSAPMRYFVEEMCDLASVDGVDQKVYKVRNDDLYGAYTRWADEGRMYVLNKVHFGRELLTAYEGQIASGWTGKTKVKYGIRLKGGQ